MDLFLDPREPFLPDCISPDEWREYHQFLGNYVDSWHYDALLISIADAEETEYPF